MANEILKECIGSTQTITTKSSATARSRTEASDSIVARVLAIVIDTVSHVSTPVGVSRTLSFDNAAAAEKAKGYTGVAVTARSATQVEDSVLLITREQVSNVTDVAEAVVTGGSTVVHVTAGGVTQVTDRASTPMSRVAVRNTTLVSDALMVHLSAVVVDAIVSMEDIHLPGAQTAADLIGSTQTAVSLELAKITDMIQASETMRSGARRVTASCTSAAR